jgi:hypothetical protein
MIPSSESIVSKTIRNQINILNIKRIFNFSLKNVDDKYVTNHTSNAHKNAYRSSHKGSVTFA